MKNFKFNWITKPQYFFYYSLCSYAFWVYLGVSRLETHKSLETLEKHSERTRTQRQWDKSSLLLYFGPFPSNFTKSSKLSKSYKSHPKLWPPVIWHIESRNISLRVFCHFIVSKHICHLKKSCFDSQQLYYLNIFGSTAPAISHSWEFNSFHVPST